DRPVDNLGKYAGESPVHMWTSGAVDMWITVAAQSPCQAPGLSGPAGDHPPPECAGPGDPAPPGHALPVSGTEPPLAKTGQDVLRKDHAQADCPRLDQRVPESGLRSTQNTGSEPLCEFWHG